MMTNLFSGPVHFNRPEDLGVKCAPRLTSCELFMNDRQPEKNKKIYHIFVHQDNLRFAENRLV